MPTVLHLLPRDLARGAQRHARMLCDGLAGAETHVVAVLYGLDRGVSKPDITISPEVTSSPTLVQRARTVLRLRRVLREVRPRLVVVHGSEPLWHAAALVRRERLLYHRIGISNIVGQPGPTSALRRAVHRTLLRRPMAIVAVSSDVASELEHRFSVPATRIRVIPNGRDPREFFPATDGIPAPRQVPRLGFVGSLSSSKRPELFVEIVRSVADEVACHGVMVGEGPEEKRLTSMVDRSPVELLGRCDDVASFLRTLDLFVFTSLPAGEGLPGVLIEAAMTGLPIVTTDVPGARDVVLDDVTGVVVDPGDRVGLTTAVRSLLTDGARRRRMAVAARDRAVAELSLEACLDGWRRLLDAEPGSTG